MMRFFSAVLMMAVVTACGANKPVVVAEEKCEAALSSFMAAPTVSQTTEEKLRFLAAIKSEQETDFGKSCERFPHWRSRFDEAYRRAVSQASLGSDSEVSDYAVSVTTVKTGEE